MKKMIENYLNGNLTDARRQAKRYGQRKIAAALEEAGLSAGKAMLAALWIKTGVGWQASCDAK